MEEQDEVWLAPLLGQRTALTASDLWRLCRQIDRGGVSDACRYLAAASVRRAKSEIDGGLEPSTSYIHELSRLQPFLEIGAARDPEAMEIWANIILDAPRNTRTQDMCETARLGLAWARFQRGDASDAWALLEKLRAQTLARREKLSDFNRNELNYFSGCASMAHGHYADALDFFEAVPAVESDDAIYSLEYSAFALAHLGRLEEAQHRVAELVVRYHFDKDENGGSTEQWADELSSEITRIAAGKTSRNGNLF